MRTIDVETQLGQSVTVIAREYWSMALRRKWVIISSILLCLTAAGMFCAISPKMYRSGTMILVEEQKIPENYVQGVVEGNLEQRIFIIQKQVMSRALLTDIVKEFNLYPDKVAKYGLDEAIAGIQNEIRVEMLTRGARANLVGRGIEAFMISFAHEDPSTARKVTSSIASQFIEQNLKAREETAQGTTQFLDYEVAGAKRELERKEDEISRFKSGHMGELPQQIEANLRALDRLQDDLNAVNEGVQRLSDRQAVVQKAIQEYERFGRTNLSLVGGALEPDPLFRRLKELREKLIKLKAEFWDGYPDVILTKEEIRQVEAELVELYGPSAIKPGEKPFDPYLQDLRKQESELKSELAVLKQRQRLVHEEKRDYVQRVERAPAVEQELLILQRDYDNMKNNYRSLLDKRLNARVAENLEKRQQGEQFRIIDPADLPRAAERPNRRLIMLFGLILGCAVGLGIAVMQEQLNPQFRRPEDIEQILVGPQLLAMIPDFRILNGRLTWPRMIPSDHLVGGMNGVNGGSELGTLTWKERLGNGGRKVLRESIVVKGLPTSIVAEQYRVAATRLALIRAHEPSTIAAVTSAVKGEGKTTTVVNLGYTLARDLGKRTLLLDCDFKCPVLDRYAETSDRGLADCLIDDVPVAECLVAFDEVPCWIMPVGNCGSRLNELLKTERLAAVLSELREQFEYILINTPPILPLADMNVLANYSDVLLLVVRAGSTPQQYVKRAVGNLRANKPIHVILNAVRSNSLPYYMFDSYYQPVGERRSVSSDIA